MDGLHVLFSLESISPWYSVECMSPIVQECSSFSLSLSLSLSLFPLSLLFPIPHDHTNTFIQVHVRLPDVVYNTLLELYLSDMGSEEDRASREMKAMNLLQKPEVCSYGVHCMSLLHYNSLPVLSSIYPL